MAEKYLDVARSADSRVEYHDDHVRIEPNIVIVKTESPAYDLSGFRAWKYTLKRKHFDKAEPVIWKELTALTLLQWAKTQHPKTLRIYLAAQGIEASGSNVYPLAALLYYIADEQERKANGTWPPLGHAIRSKRIKLIMQYKDIPKGGITDEAIIVKVLNAMGSHHQSTHPSPKEQNMAKAAEKTESPAEIRRRLLAKAESEPEEEAEETEPEVEAEKEEPEATSEQEAIRGGKSKGKRTAPVQPQPVAGKGKKAAKPTTKPVEEDAGEQMDEESEDMAKKKGAKKGTTATAKAAPKKAKGPAQTGSASKAFPIGSTVKYTGTRVAKHTGKIGEVTGYRGDGVALKFKDGSTGSASPGAVELLGKKGK